MEGSSQQTIKNDTTSESEVLLDEELSNATQAIRNLNVSDNQTENISKLSMPANYLEMQCPFTWEMFSSSNESHWEKVYIEKLERADCIDLSFFCYALNLACFYGLINNMEKALENFNHCEKLLVERCGVPFFKEIAQGMNHVVGASKCHFYFKTNQPLVAAEMSLSFQPFEDLSNESKACVWVVKSFTLSNFGYDGKMEAYECVKRAIELDPDEDGSRRGFWYYRAGKLLGECRRFFSGDEMPKKEELKHLERSVVKDPFPIHYAVLADAYRETSKIVMKKYRNFSMANKLSEQSLALYKKALKDDFTTITLLNRCATGLIKLPHKYRDVQLAEDCLYQVLRMKPDNAQAYMSLGNIEDWNKRNPTAALEFFEKSFEYGNNFAGLRIIKVKYQLDKSYNPMNDCDKYISVIQERKINDDKVSNVIAGIFALKGEYYLLFKKDLVAAAQEWEKALDISPKSRAVLEHLRCFVGKEPCPPWNLYEILEQQIKDALVSSLLSETDTKYLKGLLKKYENA